MTVLEDSQDSEGIDFDFQCFKWKLHLCSVLAYDKAIFASEKENLSQADFLPEICTKLVKLIKKNGLISLLCLGLSLVG